jgi:single-strand DNA-binding protein
MSMITLTGNLAADPEMRYLSEGKAVTNFTVMVNRRVKQGEQWVDANVTGWRVSCWEQLAENVAERLKKGDPVIVQGTAEEKSWEQDGQTRYRIEVTARSVGLDLGKVRAPQNQPVAARASLPPVPEKWDEVPF